MSGIDVGDQVVVRLGTDWRTMLRARIALRMEVEDTGCYVLVTEAFTPFKCAPAASRENLRRVGVKDLVGRSVYQLLATDNDNQRQDAMVWAEFRLVGRILGERDGLFLIARNRVVDESAASSATPTLRRSARIAAQHGQGR